MIKHEVAQQYHYMAFSTHSFVKHLCFQASFPNNEKSVLLLNIVLLSGTILYMNYTYTICIEY